MFEVSMMALMRSGISERKVSKLKSSRFDSEDIILLIDAMIIF